MAGGVLVDKNIGQTYYQSPKSKTSPSRRSAEGAERRDSFICCGAEDAKNTNTAQEDEYSRSSRDREEAPTKKHKAPNRQHMTIGDIWQNYAHHLHLTIKVVLETWKLLYCHLAI